MHRIAGLTIIGFSLATVAPLAAQALPDTVAGYTDTTLMIPMRDGVKLHTRLFRPKNQSESLPFVMLRTPYGIAGASRQFRSYLKELADDGYLFVFQDIRGRYTSEGQFLMNRGAQTYGGVCNDYVGLSFHQLRSVGAYAAWVAVAPKVRNL